MDKQPRKHKLGYCILNIFFRPSFKTVEGKNGCRLRSDASHGFLWIHLHNN